MRANPTRRVRRIMIPREHGAYAELLFPILAVILGGVPVMATWLFALAVVACFVANEPILVLAGQRGSRAQREQRSQALRMLLAMVLIAILAAASAVRLAPPAATYLALVPLMLGAFVVRLATRGLERGLLGELAAAAALSSVALPLGVTAGLGVRAASAVAVIWFVASIFGTSVARLSLAGTRAKTESEVFRVRSKWALLFLASAAMVVLSTLAPLAPRGPLWILPATLPVSLIALAFSIAKPRARDLRLVGWGLVFANLCTLVVVVGALRLITDYVTIRSALPFPSF